MRLLGRLAGGIALFALLYGINWWATAVLQAADRPDLEGSWFYRQFPVYYPVVLEVGRWVILAVSLNLINGLAGQFSLGHAAFAAIGGYTSAAVTVFVGQRLFGTVMDWYPGKAPVEWNGLFAVSLIAGGMVASLIGFLVGLPSLRLRGDYLAITTLGFGEVVRVIIEHIQSVGGSEGFHGLPLITNFFWIYVVAIATIVAVRNIAQSTHGRALLAIRDDEVAAEAMGVPLTRYKVLAFVIGSFFAGMAGGLFAHSQGSVQPTQAGFLESIKIVVVVVLGGSGSITGSVLAAVILTVLPEILRTVAPALEQYRMVLYALLLIIMMLVRPQGLLGTRELSLAPLWKRLRKPG